MSLTIQKFIIESERQDAHITDHKIHKDQQLWKDIMEYDKFEALRMGWKKYVY